jgi:CRISPR-associated endonuclease Csn1
MPLFLKDTLDTNEKVEEYCRENLGYQEPSVRMSRIKMYSLVKVNGALFYLTGRTGNQLILSNAMELKLPYVWSKYIKRLFSSVIISAPEIFKDGFFSLQANNSVIVYTSLSNPVSSKRLIPKITLVLVLF